MSTLTDEKAVSLRSIRNKSVTKTTSILWQILQLGPHECIEDLIIEQ